MDTKHFEYFRVVYEEKSIHAAARKLFISPQGLGRIIQDIENEFGTSFFTRTKNGVFPTEEGILFYEQCVRTSQELDILHLRIRQMEERNHSIRIGFATGTLQLFPLEVLFRFIEENPKIQVNWCEYHNPELISKILESEVDYGFIVGNAPQDRLVQHLRCVCPVVLLVYKGHPLYHEKIISLDMLKEEKLILMNEMFQIYHDFLRACRLHGFEPRVIAKTMDGATLYRLCTAGLGVAVSPHFPDQNLQNVRAIPLVGDYNWEIYGTWLKEQESNESIRLLDNFLKNELT